MDADCHRYLGKKGFPVTLHPSPNSYWRLLTAEFVVMDSAEWVKRGIYQAAFCSKLVQLWHGAPLKQIEIPLYLQRKSELPRFVRLLLDLQKMVIGRYPRFDLLVSTSSFFSRKAFLDAFKSKVIIESGYPRNDAMLNYRDDTQWNNSPVWINTDSNALKVIRQARIRGKKIVLYAPTFRKNMHDPFQLEILDLMSFSTFAEAYGLLVVMKLHPTMGGRIQTFNDAAICVYDSIADIYPALPLFDCLVTDYSSIFFDFLLVDKLIVFFCYDLEQYKSEDRSLLFDFNTMTPGPKCFKQNELESALKTVLIESVDEYSEDRQRVCDLAFDDKDGQSSKRIWEYMTGGLIP
jgi:CDP-glycerol glycerophosphotransferase